MTKTHQLLKQHFGYDSFRPGQAEIIEQILQRRDTVGIMPTSAGKSICFQIPALLLDGITIVISPLISLMADQVRNLNETGIPAVFINSTLTSSAYFQAISQLRNGYCKIVYIAPERLETESFLEFAASNKIAMIAVDEAHCLSQWGQDFRPSYLKIFEFIETLSERPIVSAFTATATTKVRDDIIEKLHLQEPFILTTGFNRANLFFSVKKPIDKNKALQDILQEHAGKSGIVYCATRKNVEHIYELLINNGHSVTRYHAGLSDKERKQNQEAFLFDRREIVVATNAFGMGIDKSDVRFVVHYNMPKNIESYYQEAGRAGRDGEQAECILLYSGQDIITNKFLIDHVEENQELDQATRSAIKEKDHELLKQMIFYCHTNDCLRTFILHYFGDTDKVICDNCDNCQEEFETIEITEVAKEILLCIQQLRQRYGVKVLLDTLRGKNNKRIQSLGLNRLSTFAVLTNKSEADLRSVITFLQLHGYIEATNTDYPILLLKEKAAQVLEHRVSLSMKARTESKSHAEKTKKGRRKKPIFSQVKNHRLFAQLRALRLQLAQEQSIPAFMVFSDATLSDMCAKLPQTELEMLNISGIGHAKMERYGQHFLAEIQIYCEKKMT